METSMSISKGKGNIKHNTRTQLHQPKNVDSSRTPLNRNIIDRNISDVYHQLFDSAAAQYNSKQKRSDRKIDDYYRKVLQDKKTKPFHELVVQIGNIDARLPDDQYDRIYEEFVDEFQKKNPQMVVFGAYVHHDEVGACHAHIDYIPVATYSRGMEKRVSNNRAIKQMGYNSWETWREEQFVLLEEVASRYDISRQKMNNTERHRTVDGYKKEQKLIEKRLAVIEENLSKSKIEPKKSILGKETVDYATFREIEKENQLLKAQISASNERYEKLEKEYQKIKNKPYKQENDRLHEDNKRLRKILRRDEKEYNDRANFFQKQIDQYETKTKTLEQKVNDLEETNSFLLKFIHRLRLGRFMKKVFEMTFSRISIEKLSDDVFEKGLDNAKALFVEEREYEKHLLERSRGRSLGR